MRQALRDAAAFEGDECLKWPLYIGNGGRGYAFKDGKRVIASRLVCEMRHGPAPSPEHVAAHNCGKGHLACVNGRHLRWATQQENLADMIAHGTHKRGERNPSAKLNRQQVEEIRAAYPAISQRKIAAQYGVDQSLISQIILRKVWT